VGVTGRSVNCMTEIYGICYVGGEDSYYYYYYYYYRWLCLETRYEG